MITCYDTCDLQIISQVFSNLISYCANCPFCLIFQIFKEQSSCPFFSVLFHSFIYYIRFDKAVLYMSLHSIPIIVLWDESITLSVLQMVTFQIRESTFLFGLRLSITQKADPRLKSKSSHSKSSVVFVCGGATTFNFLSGLLSGSQYILNSCNVVISSKYLSKMHLSHLPPAL